MAVCQRKIWDLESYYRKCNLRLYGVPENESVRRETIRIWQEVLPEEKADVIDTVHRLCATKPKSAKPRGIILHFTSRFYRDATWKAAKKSTFLRDNNLRFAEDREKRNTLWPAVEKAWKEGKVAYFVGGRGFINGSKIILPTWRSAALTGVWCAEFAVIVVSPLSGFLNMLLLLFVISLFQGILSLTFQTSLLLYWVCTLCQLVRA